MVSLYLVAVAAVWGCQRHLGIISPAYCGASSCRPAAIGCVSRLLTLQLCDADGTLADGRDSNGILPSRHVFGFSPELGQPKPSGLPGRRGDETSARALQAQRGGSTLWNTATHSGSSRRRRRSLGISGGGKTRRRGRYRPEMRDTNGRKAVRRRRCPGRNKTKTHLSLRAWPRRRQARTGLIPVLLDTRAC